jgi:hypothetical protein
MKAKVKKKRGRQLKKRGPEIDAGKFSFVLGLALAIIIGVILGVSNAKLGLGVGITYAIIFVLGLIVGILNITIKEVNEFLIASITFIVAAQLDIYVINMTLPALGALIAQIFVAIGIFAAPAATVVALKAMYELANKK